MNSSAEQIRSWHTVSVQQVFNLQKSSHEGLTGAEALCRLGEHGLNELTSSHQVSLWRILLSQFKNVLIVILLIATLLSAFLGHGIEAVAILVIVMFSVILGFIQEYRSEKAIEALMHMAAPMACVFRDGTEIEIPARELVPGDVIIFRAGDKIPADARIVKTVNLQIEEAALTGESVPVEKSTENFEKNDLPVGDRKNMAYAGTAVTYGWGKGVIVGTGMETEFGKIAKMLQMIETGRTPLQENLDRVGSMLMKAAVVIVLVIITFGLFRGQPFIEMLIFGIALAVAVVPEALPAVVTISLALGVKQMVKRHALIRRLPVVETLGSTSVICSDKTGTLTKDEMTVCKIFVPGLMLDVSGAGYEPKGEFTHNGSAIQLPEPVKLLLKAGTLASDAHIFFHPDEHRWKMKGDPTEGALVVVAAKAGFDKVDLEQQLPRVDEIPFTSETKRMTTIHKSPEGTIAYSKGALEIVLDSCDRQVIFTNGTIEEMLLDQESRRTIHDNAHSMATEALRVLAIAMKKGSTRGDAESGMTFLGMVGMIDPPRQEAKAAVKECNSAGIKVVMITGDHPVTAQTIAQDLGILKTGRVVTGIELDNMSDEELEREVENIDVYARVSPAHKLRVVTAFQKNGHVVAMTGDGVNDAPALKKADIGIAMGITGTDVTKEASAMMLTDDNFASIVAAVKEGRGIFANIKKYLMYLLSSNLGEIGLMAGAILCGLPLPLGAVQILYVNLATDGLPALALSVNPHDTDIMSIPPRNPRVGIFTRSVVSLMLISGLWSTIAMLSLFIWNLQSGRNHEEATTMTFVCLVLIQFFNAYNFRSGIYSAFSRPFTNKWLNIAIVWEIILLLLIVYVPFLHPYFGTFSLTWEDWQIVLIVSFTIIPVLEIAKWFGKHGFFGSRR